MRILARAIPELTASLLWRLECLACAGATRLTEGPICAPCLRALPAFGTEVCRICGIPFPPVRRPRALDAGRCCGACLRKKPPFAALRSFGPYEGALRELVHAFKFEADARAGKMLGGLLLRAASLRPEMLHTDAITHVPSHWTRRLMRGFTPARVLAHGLAREASLPLMRLLRKRKMTPSQTDLPWKQRAANVRGVFAPTRLMRRKRPAVVLLVDDVFTTGATMRACARALRRGGAKAVFAATVARTLPRREAEEFRHAARGLDAAASVGL